MSRDIKLLVVHCSATPASHDIGAKEIRQWHLDRNWSDIGYHYVIRRDGTVEKGRDDSISGAHAKGFNSNSLGVCLVGGVNDDLDPDSNFTINQFNSLSRLLKGLKVQYPDAEIKGHRDLKGVKKACPSFDVVSFISQN